MGNTPPAHEGIELDRGLVLHAELVEDDEELGLERVTASIGKPFLSTGEREWVSCSHPDRCSVRAIEEDLEAIRCAALLPGTGMVNPVRLEQGGDRPRPDA